MGTKATVKHTIICRKSTRNVQSSRWHEDNGPEGKSQARDSLLAKDIKKTAKLITFVTTFRRQRMRKGSLMRINLKLGSE